MSTSSGFERIASMRALYALVASEDDLFHHGVATLLGHAKNISLHQSRTFRSALPQIRIHRYDYIVVDKNLGGGDGFSLGPVIKRINPDSLSILVVSEDHWATTEAARSLGYSMVIRLSELSDALASLPQSSSASETLTGNEKERIARQKLERLSEREREILTDISQGKRNYEIASFRHISEGTIKSHLSSIYRKLEVRNRVEAISMMNSY